MIVITMANGGKFNIYSMQASSLVVSSNEPNIAVVPVSLENVEWLSVWQLDIASRPLCSRCLHLCKSADCREG